MAQKCTLHCGRLSYEVTPEARKTLEGLMYWTHVLNLERAEPEPNEQAINEAELSVKDRMNECEKLGVPNWAGNGAMQFARDNDLRVTYMSDFFDLSPYSEKAHRERNKIAEKE